MTARKDERGDFERTPSLMPAIAVVSPIFTRAELSAVLMGLMPMEVALALSNDLPSGTQVRVDEFCIVLFRIQLLEGLGLQLIAGRRCFCCHVIQYRYICIYD